MLTFGEAADPAVVGIAPERVDHLLGRSPGWGLPGLLLGLGAASIVLIGLLAWQVGRDALLTTSLNLPLLSSQPCVVVLALVPFALSAGAVWLLRRSSALWG
jgi:hypothetical protein